MHVMPDAATNTVRVGQCVQGPERPSWWEALAEAVSFGEFPDQLRLRVGRFKL